MAKSPSEYHRGEMDITEQVSTFHLFNNLTKWGSLYLASLLVLLVLWFCTPTGFFGALITAIVVSVIGFIVLKDKKGASGH